MAIGAEWDIFNDITHLYKFTYTYNLAGCSVQEEQASKFWHSNAFYIKITVNYILLII
jgi:hypothetical protein